MLPPVCRQSHRSSSLKKTEDDGLGGQITDGAVGRLRKTAPIMALSKSTLRFEPAYMPRFMRA
jgi:hypothetical protein